MSTAAALLTLVLASLATYACRALGVVLSSRVSNTGAVFQWVSCVTYAMIAALTSRMIFMPSG
ncbi:MAG: AzlD domain-containing protein, partial [Burkholderiaceae bacterium]|nr:AzlD domain-containing protein [Burkholderiaceae bacterium]